MENKIKAGDAVKMSQFCVNDKGNTFIPWHPFLSALVGKVGYVWFTERNRFNFEYAHIKFNDGATVVRAPLKNLTKVLDIK